MITPARLRHTVLLNELNVPEFSMVGLLTVLNICFPSYLMFSFGDIVVKTNTTKGCSWVFKVLTRWYLVKVSNQCPIMFVLLRSWFGIFQADFGTCFVNNSTFLIFENISILYETFHIVVFVVCDCCLITSYIIA